MEIEIIKILKYITLKLKGIPQAEVAERLNVIEKRNKEKESWSQSKVNLTFKHSRPFLVSELLTFHEAYPKLDLINYSELKSVINSPSIDNSTKGIHKTQTEKDFINYISDYFNKVLIGATFIHQKKKREVEISSLLIRSTFNYDSIVGIEGDNETRSILHILNVERKKGKLLLAPMIAFADSDIENRFTNFEKIDHKLSNVYSNKVGDEVEGKPRFIVTDELLENKNMILDSLLEKIKDALIETHAIKLNAGSF